MEEHGHSQGNGGDGTKVKKDKKVKIRLKERDTEPDPVRISVANEDTIVWECDPNRRFWVSIKAEHTCNAPKYPFKYPTYSGPIESQEEEVLVNGEKKLINRVRVGPALPAAVHHEYKATFKIAGEAKDIDPHIIVDP